jgi:hypothetical protein
MRLMLSQPRTILATAAALFLAATSISLSAGQAPQTRTIDDATLLKPAQGDWVNPGRDYAETHHSPLTQIDQTNVSRLAPAWSVEVGSQGKIETTPIVANGVLYGTSTYSVVYAVDAKTGALKWRWDPALVKGGIADGAARFCCGPVNRGVAIYKDKVYVGLLDGRLVALNAETGHVAWAVELRPSAGLQHHGRAAHREGQGRHRQWRRRVRRARLPHGLRRRDRQTGVALVRGARRSIEGPRRPVDGDGAEDVEGRMVAVRRRRHAVGRHRLRPRGQPGLRGHRQRLAVGAHPPQRRHRRQPLPGRSSRSTPTPAATCGTTRRRPATTGTTTPRSR